MSILGNSIFGRGASSKDVNKDFLLKRDTDAEKIQRFVNALFRGDLNGMRGSSGCYFPASLPGIDTYIAMVSWETATVSIKKYGYAVDIVIGYGGIGVPNCRHFCLPKNKLTAQQIDRLEKRLKEQAKHQAEKKEASQAVEKKRKPADNAHAVADMLREKTTSARKVRQLFNQWWPRRCSSVTVGYLDIVFEVTEPEEETTEAEDVTVIRRGLWDILGFGARTILRFPRSKLTQKQIDQASAKAKLK